MTQTKHRQEPETGLSSADSACIPGVATVPVEHGHVRVCGVVLVFKALVTLGTPYQEQLKVDDVINIAEKVAFQPPAVDVIRHDVFPAA